MRIYRKIRQIKEIVEYRRFALFFLPGQPLKQQSGSQNGVDEQLIKQMQVIILETGQSILFVTRVTGYRNAAFMKPEQPLFSLVLEPAQRAAFT